MTSMGIFRRKTSHGYRWYGQWWVDGRRVTRSLGPEVKARTQAQKIWDQVEHNRIMGKLGVLDSSPLTLGQLRTKFLEAKAPHLAPKSMARYDVSIRMLTRDFGDGVKAKHLTSSKLSAWSSKRLADGVSPAGVNCDLRHIRAALNWATRNDLLEKAPVIEMVRTTRPLPRHLKAEQVEALLTASPPERRRLWTFFIWTGMRRLEARELGWSQVQWDPPAATVVGKGGKERLVPLLPLAVAAMAGLPAPDGPVCPWPRQDLGTVWPDVTADIYTRWFQRDRRAAKLKNVRLHDLRHTAITYMISRGVKPRVVQEIVGHESIVTTEGYSRAIVADLYEQMMEGL
jgi:integrase